MSSFPRHLLYSAVALALIATTAKVGAGETAASARVTLPVFADATAVDAFCIAGLARVETAAKAMAKVPLERAADITTLHQWDALGIEMDDLSGPISIASATSPEKPVRDAAEACDLKLSALQTSLYQNAEIYQRISRIVATQPAAIQVKAVALEGFEDAGVSLPADKRARAKEIYDKLDALGIEFQRNTREKLGTVSVSMAELEGMPASYLASHQPDEKGIVKLGMNYPDYVPFLENAASSEARRRYYLAFNQIGGERNLAILNEASTLRKELATLFGKPSFAHHVITRRMAGSPEKVHAFLASVQSKVGEFEQRDLDILRQAKADFLGRPLNEVKIERWDTAFYSERVRRAKYAVDQNALRRYFPTDAAAAWLTDLAQRLYGVRFVAATVPTWHADVRYFDIFDKSGKRIAGAYFDLYPREGKYNHAAVWGVRGASTRVGRTPISVMVANMNRDGLDHRELETLLHEFGHMLHGTLSRTEYNALAGTGVRRDFVEAPSQMLEEWARNTEPLALIRNHCKDCPKMDDKLLTRINQARRFGAGIHYGRQQILASFDMAMAGPAPGDGQATYKALEAASPLGVTPEAMFPARFGHLLGGYAAGYYGYMWSEVIALDMASQWKGKWFDAKVSQRYLDQVLSRGGETPSDQVVRNFLGREPSPEPFFAEITGKDGSAKASREHRK
jgi:thimet oligopeptidase